MPAAACTPVMSSAFPAVLLAYLVWLILSLLLYRSYRFCGADLERYAVTVPIGFCWFAVPSMLLGIPFAILFLAFPMHLAVEFCAALFSRSTQGDDRAARLVYYGVPLAITLFGGITGKWMMYSKMGGWRSFLVNLSANSSFFGTVSFGIGVLVLISSILRERKRVRAEAQNVSAQGV